MKINQIMTSTMITEIETFDVSNLVFMPAVRGEITSSDGKPPIIFRRIPIRIKNPDGSTGQLIFSPKNLFSFGVSENTNATNGSITGYTLPLVLWDKNGVPSEEQKMFTDVLEELIEACKQHLIKDDIRKSIAKPTLTYGALESLNKLIYWKCDKDTGARVEGASPMLYPKLYTRNNNGQIDITTEFWDSEGRDIDPMTLTKKRFGHVNSCIVVDCIFLGANSAIQTRVREAEYNATESLGRRLLSRPKANTTLGGGDYQGDDYQSRDTDASTFKMPEQTTEPPAQASFQINDNTSPPPPEPEQQYVAPTRSVARRVPATRKK